MTPLIIAHRGASLVAPENTIAAFERALQSGADGIEFDVRLSRDGVPVVIHDATLQRTGLVKGRVAELTADELEQIDVGSWFSSETTPTVFARERIPRLARVLKLCANSKGLLYVELKLSPRERAELAHAVSKLVREFSMADRVVVESFDLASLEAIKACDGEIRTAALFQRRWMRHIPFLRFETMIDLTVKSGAGEIALHHNLIDKRTVDAALAADLKIIAWTVDNPVWIDRACELGISALITNDPEGMLRHRGEPGND
ncbi:MAG TPA: glycerophosphodiester phosphodiesterase family protein [Pyrinomonadaceae bacterium]|nr:glycerophosphodiester phosphodiesterase family protein [Pyrinomonadaceae bacterium]